MSFSVPAVNSRNGKSVVIVGGGGLLNRGLGNSGEVSLPCGVRPSVYELMLLEISVSHVPAGVGDNLLCN